VCHCAFALAPTFRAAAAAGTQPFVIGSNSLANTGTTVTGRIR